MNSYRTGKYTEDQFVNDKPVSFDYCTYECEKCDKVFTRFDKAEKHENKCKKIKK